MLQRTPDWEFERAGLLTASDFAAAMGISPFKSRLRLWDELTGRSAGFQGNAASDWGTLHEESAIEHYEAKTGMFVDPVGLIKHPQISYLGGSPDGLVGEEGIIEAKCPYWAGVHMEVPEYYLPQIHGNMAITGRRWCDFISSKFVETEDDFILQDQIIIRLEFDPVYWEWALGLLAEFWGFVERDERPPRLRRKPNFEDYINERH